MATSQSDDVEELINRLCGPLSAGDRGDFRRAAEAALAQLPCSGPGIAFRTLRELFRSYFHPPDDHAVCGPRHQRRRSSKLLAAPAVGASDPREGARDRRRLRAV